MKSLHSEEYRRFAEALAEARKAAGISQQELAKRLLVDQSFVSKFETARRRLDVVEFLQIAAALKLDVEHFLSALDLPKSAGLLGRKVDPNP